MRIAIIRLKDLLQNYQFIPRVDHTSVENLRKNSLFRHNALSHFLKDRTSAVAFFSNLCQLQDYIIALEFRADRKCGKVDSLNHQVLSECPVFYLCTSGAKIFNLVKREQTYLTVPFAGMGITLDSPVLNYFNLRNTCLLYSLSLTCTNRNYFSHKIIPFTFLFSFQILFSYLLFRLLPSAYLLCFGSPISLFVSTF